MNEKVSIVLEEAIREVVEVDFSNDQLAWGKLMRVRVNINIHKPIKRGKMITVEGGKKILTLLNIRD